MMILASKESSFADFTFPLMQTTYEAFATLCATSALLTLLTMVQAPLVRKVDSVIHLLNNRAKVASLICFRPCPQVSGCF